eukprot:90506-Amorphochlora_amoeboformis.AAC.1
MNFTPDQFAAAQERMKDMSSEDLAEQMRNAQSNYSRMNAMGVDPSMMATAMKMMQENPNLMRMAQDQMRNMTPEQLASMSNMAKRRYSGGENSSSKGGPGSGTGGRGARSSMGGPRLGGGVEGSTKSGEGAGSAGKAVKPISRLGKRILSMKEEGVALHRSKKYTEALDKYEDAILELDDTEHKIPENDLEALQQIREACHLNAAACHIEVKSYRKAVRECTAVIKQRGPHVKAFFRRATAKRKM